MYFFKKEVYYFTSRRKIKSSPSSPLYYSWYTVFKGFLKAHGYLSGRLVTDTTIKLEIWSPNYIPTPFLFITCPLKEALPIFYCSSVSSFMYWEIFSIYKNEKQKNTSKLVISESQLHPDLALAFCFDILKIENTDQRRVFENVTLPFWNILDWPGCFSFEFNPCPQPHALFLKPS